MNSLHRQIHFTSSIKRKIAAGFILCIYLDFIIIFLQPFDTAQFDAAYKDLLLSGYGILAFIVFVVQGLIENRWYYNVGRVWTVIYEIMAALCYCFFSGTVLYLYNRYVVNDLYFSLPTYWRFLSSTVVYMAPVIIPPMLYLRQKFGERLVPHSNSSVVLTGENKNEQLKLEKEDLLFVKAVENYIEICFVDKNKRLSSKTFRQTLSNVCEQAPFLKKCHRSYLVNLDTIGEITGNSQGAKISFIIGEKEIPLSKTYYKDIKKSLN